MKKVFLVFTVLFSLSSCASYKLENKKVKLSEINNLAYFDPLSFVNLIHKDNTLSTSDSLSLLSKRILDTVITNYKNFSVSRKIVLENIKLQQKVDKELNYLVEKIMHYHQISNVKLTPTLDSVLKQKQQRFALVTVIAGLGLEGTHDKHHRIKRIQDDDLTLQMYLPIATKPISTLFAIIIDSERGEVIFYDHTTPVHKSPTETSVLKHQYRKLFKGYYHN